LFIDRRADAYGNTIIFTGPGADGVWFTDDDVQSSYGANEIIYCGYSIIFKGGHVVKVSVGEL